MQFQIVGRLHTRAVPDLTCCRRRAPPACRLPAFRRPSPLQTSLAVPSMRSGRGPGRAAQLSTQLVAAAGGAARCAAGIRCRVARGGCRGLLRRLPADAGGWWSGPAVCRGAYDPAIPPHQRQTCTSCRGCMPASVHASSCSIALMPCCPADLCHPWHHLPVAAGRQPVWRVARQRAGGRWDYGPTNG